MDSNENPILTADTEQGVVIACKNNFATVRIERNSACASCGKCGMTEKQKHVEFFVENTLGAKAGDIVSVQIPERNVASLAFIAYLLPLVPAIAAMLVANALNLATWAVMLMFVGGLVVGGLTVLAIDRIRKHKWMQAPRMVEILKNNR